MYLDTNGHGPGGQPERERRQRPELSLNEQKVLFWIAGLNIVLLLVAPIGGATLFDVVTAWFR
ncbi:hypothetical protein [Rhizobium sp. C4]|uniref:hypothetical protein n=1 Tax=Rhizobium sp. C4 TaxID=1349800 RepID=UPI001E3E2337|nr:hypothetical protein [Rhizobium sp. C4]MCD2173879.1 hypothetical protein [Rhizobium sp. C4]